MRKIFLLFTFVLSAFVFIADAQKKSEWTRIETENKEVSVSFPPDFLVDAEKKDYDNQRLRVIAFHNGVQMEFLIYDYENPRKYLQQVKTDGESKTIGSGDEALTLKRKSSDDDDEKYFANTILLASKNSFYCFIIKAETADKPEVSRFLYSIKARGKSIFAGKNTENEISGKVVSTTDLKISPEVATALSQTTNDPNRKINYEFKKIELPEKEFDISLRPAIILIDPYPAGKSLSVRPAFLVSRLGQNSGTATIKIKLLSNGTVGDITIFSMSDRRILYEFVEGIKNIRFLPAIKNGKPVDSEEYINFEFEYY